MLSSALLTTRERDLLQLPDHPVVDRVRESMRQHFYFIIIEYALAHPDDPMVTDITNHAKWAKQFQAFWDHLPYHAQSRLMELFNAMITVWNDCSPREKEVTARTTMKHFLIECASHEQMQKLCLNNISDR